MNLCWRANLHSLKTQGVTRGRSERLRLEQVTLLQPVLALGILKLGDCVWSSNPAFAALSV
ncbi:hypothetical protein EMIT0373P_11609 [Pseudomonas chlororaphis]